MFVREGESGRELVLRVCDSTLEQRGAEVYVPLARIGYQPETWFHLQASVRGCDPTLMELLVDGDRRAASAAGISYLTSAPLDGRDVRRRWTAREGFEAQGAVLIGDEVVEYDNASGDALIDCHRGKRGTRARDWPEGAAVKRARLLAPDAARRHEGRQRPRAAGVGGLEVHEGRVRPGPGHVPRRAASAMIWKGMKEDTQTAEIQLDKPDPDDASRRRDDGRRPSTRRATRWS